MQVAIEIVSILLYSNMFYMWLHPMLTTFEMFEVTWMTQGWLKVTWLEPKNAIGVIGRPLLVAGHVVLETKETR